MQQISTTKAEGAYAELRARILDGSLPPGSSLEQATIAESYGISTTPVREALRRLESEQLVVVRAHHGPRVAELSTAELHHLFAVRLELDPLAASLAATEASADEIHEIRRILETPSGSPAGKVAANREFHRSIYQACGNPVLAQVLDSLWNRCDRYRFLLVGLDTEGDTDDLEHHAMADAMEAREAQLMRRLVSAHIRHSYNKLAKLAEEYTRAHADATRGARASMAEASGV